MIAATFPWGSLLILVGTLGAALGAQFLAGRQQLKLEERKDRAEASRREREVEDWRRELAVHTIHDLTEALHEYADVWASIGIDLQDRGFVSDLRKSAQLAKITARARTLMAATPGADDEPGDYWDAWLRLMEHTAPILDSKTPPEERDKRLREIPDKLAPIHYALAETLRHL